MVQYLCTFAAKATSTQQDVSITFKVDVPIITTYPVSTPETLGGLFGQLSMVTIKIISQKDIYPEDVVEMVDKHALAPVYSFLAEKDQHYLIQKIHSQRKTSVQVLDEIKEELFRNLSIEWYSVRSSNYGMLHAYSTVIGIEKSMWVPFSSHHQEEI